MTYPTHSQPTVLNAPQPVAVVNEVATDAAQPTWAVVLQALTNIIVIVTSLAVLYTLWVVYSGLAQLGDALSNLGG